MDKTIKIYTRSVYGAPRVYILDEKQAANVSALTGSKTLEQRHIDALTAMGFTLVPVLDPKFNR